MSYNMVFLGGVGGGGFIHCRKKPLPQCSEAHSRVTVLILSVLHC